MKKILLILGLSSFFLAGCAATQPSSKTAQQQQWQAKNIKSNVNALNQAPQFRGKIRVTSEIIDGNVLLMGQAVDEDNRQMVESYVQDLQGVKDTYNQIRIGKPISFDQISYDIWLTTRVKSALLSDDRLDNYNIKVVTENKEVFLMGKITTEKAEIAADIASRIDKVSKVIKAFTYTSEQKATTKATQEPNDNTAELSSNPDDQPAVEINDTGALEDHQVPIVEESVTPIDESDVM